MTLKPTKKGRIDILVSMKAILDDANRSNYGVMAIDGINIEMARVGVIATEEERSPIIIQFGLGQTKNHVHMEEMIPVMKELAEGVRAPVATNLDHGAGFCVMMDYINMGFTNVMFDGSSLPYEGNVKRTIIISALVHDMGCSTEGELGHVGQVADADDADLDLCTNPDRALDFVERTGVGVPAIAIGTTHGTYPRGKIPKLDFERLHQPRGTLRMPLVLHGGPGSDEENLRKAVAGGINKINVCTGAFEAEEAVILKLLGENPGADYLYVCMAAEAGIRKFVKDYMKVTGPSGRYIHGEEVVAGDK